MSLLGVSESSSFSDCTPCSSPSTSESKRESKWGFRDDDGRGYLVEKLDNALQEDDAKRFIKASVSGDKTGF